MSREVFVEKTRFRHECYHCCIFLECAVDGEANYIISGDKHLLDLGMYNGIQIIRAKDFLIKEKYLEK